MLGFKRRKVKESRVGSKSTKKRARKRSVSPKGDSDAQRVRKKKRLGRDRVDKPIKKSSKKKPKKYLSCSSSSDSESGSASQSSSSSSDTAYDKRRRSKKIIDKVRKRVRDSESNKPHKKRKVRSPSISVSDQSVRVSHGDGSLSPVNNFRRLRSVIAVVNQPDEGENRWEMDPQKEEIVYDHNDYPSPKSVDSNEGGSKLESVNHSHDVSSKRIGLESFAGEEVNELTKSKIDEINHQSEGAHMNIEKEKETDVSVPVAALGGDVLESILRQKALENLKKFQGRFQAGPRNTDLKLNNETHVNSPSPGTVDISLSKSTEQGNSNAREMDQIAKSDYSQPTEVKLLPDSEHVENEPVVVKQTIMLPPSEDNCPESQAVLAKYVSSNDDSSSNAFSSATVEPSSSAGLMPGELSLDKKDEGKDSSEFEQKTMSVMRGGEMVQVRDLLYSDPGFIFIVISVFR